MRTRAEKVAPVVNPLWTMGLKTIRELESDFGVLASAKEEIYGCIFGRDSLITGLKLLKTYRKTGDAYFLLLVKKILLNLSQLQGRSVNIESGEEPGKIIHEFRQENHEHLTRHPSEPWYLYPDNVMRNYDSVDSTPLFLIAVYRCFQATGGDEQFLETLKPSVYKALEWLLDFGDSNKDGFVDYQFQPGRKFGGLKTQSWMDSVESLFHEDGSPVPYPIAPAEVQAYAYLALRLWAKYFSSFDLEFASLLQEKADNLKERFNEIFVVAGNGFCIASALDGNGKPMVSARSSMGHLLWASQAENLDGVLDGILEQQFIPAVVSRLLEPDLFEPAAGIRTLSSQSSRFDPLSYHNGSIWPHDTAIIAEGFDNFGFKDEAAALRGSLKAAWEHFGTPIELFVYTKAGFAEYCSQSGQRACSKQAWSAASMLAEL